MVGDDSGADIENSPSSSWSEFDGAEFALIDSGRDFECLAR